MAQRIVIGGFATVDYVVHVDGVFRGRGVADLAPGPPGAWPRMGGAVLYAGAAMTGLGRCVQPLATLGGDAEGRAYLGEARRRGLDTSGIVVDRAATTARCVLVYDADGGGCCLIQRTGGPLGAAQRALAGAADLAVIAAGDPQAGRDLLAAAPASARLAWIVKDDPASFPPALAAELAARADYIFCNRSERLVVPRFSGPRAPVVFHTQGVEGVTVETAAGPHRLQAEPVAVKDATGAGDTFAGAALAALLDGADPGKAATLGMAAARHLLSRRARLEEAA